MYFALKPLLFALTPEKAHHLTFRMLDWAAAFPPTRALMRAMFCVTDQRLEKEAFGLRFPNIAGLAAGLDKDGEHIAGLAALGFGFVEVGTVTPLAQPGNPRPRLFRLPADRALINRMGFNNKGVDHLLANLKRYRASKPGPMLIGANIGKNKDTPNENAASDYLISFEKLFPWVDYFVVNVSSPNTPGLRALQEKEPLSRLLQLLQEKNRAMPAPKPILLKIAPDLNESQLDDIVDIVRETGLAGIVATNTTIARPVLNTPAAEVEAMGAGGLSGAPARQVSSTVIRYLRQKLGPGVAIIGVGGIDSVEAAQEKLEAGADLIQVYTGLIYEGPALVKRILTGLLSRE